MEDAKKELYDAIEDQNGKLVDHAWQIDKWKRKLADKQLIKRL